MPFTWEISPTKTVFIIASNFKNIAIFKPKSFRGKKIENIHIVWYSEIGRLLRVNGNVHRYNSFINEGGKFFYSVVAK